MIVNSVSRNQSTNFNARFKFAPELSEKFADRITSSARVSSLTSAVSTATGGSALGVGTNVLGSAFLLQASGVNSSGIVPAYLNAAASFGPSAYGFINASKAQPSIAGLGFSTLASGLSSKSMINIKIKNPS